MPIVKQDDWQKWVDANTDPYGEACIRVARRVMELLDEQPTAFDPNKLITQADNETDAGGLTGFMAGWVAQMVVHCHSRGQEFRESWNKSYAQTVKLGS